MRIRLTVVYVLAAMAAGLTTMPAHAVNCDKNPDHRQCDGGGNPPGGGGDEEEGPFIVVELGALGGKYSTARDINEQGQITGGADDTDGVAVAVIWTVNPNGSITTVGLPGLQGGGDCKGKAINNLGSVIGFCVDSSGDFRTLHWDARGEITDLENVYGMDLTAYDINDAGQIVAIEDVPTPPGQEEPEPDRTYVLDLDNGPPTLIEAPFVYGFGINLAGQVVGQSVGGPYPILPRPLWWTKVDGDDTVVELGFLTDMGWAHAINDAGQIVGGDGHDVRQPIMWTVGANGRVLTIVGLGTLGGSRGWAEDVNNAGQVVGATTTKKGKRDSEHRRAFFWENGQFTQLDVPKTFSHKSDAVAINDDGLVVGNGYESSAHRSKAILWVPTQP